MLGERLIFIRSPSMYAPTSQHLQQRKLRNPSNTTHFVSLDACASGGEDELTILSCMHLCQDLARSAATTLSYRYFSPRLPHVPAESGCSHWHAHHSGAAAARFFSPRVPHFSANSSGHEHDHHGRGAESVNEFHSPGVLPGFSHGPSILAT